MRASEVAYFVKTHRQRDERIEAADRAICLVRDGRDALVSWARLNSERDSRQFLPRLRAIIEPREERGTGSWGRNVSSWLQPATPHRILVRYADLVRDPEAVVRSLMGDLLPDAQASAQAVVPSFEDLRALDDGFFRRGCVGSHRDELPDELHALFWSRPENAVAMALIG